MAFVAIDFETTGLNSRTNRVVEVAAVVFSDSGQVIREFDSLVNPGVLIGGAHVHGIRDIDVYEAPTFSELLPEIAELLDGQTLVAHNARFDLKFLERELEIAGVEVPELDGLCTLTLLSKYEPQAPRRLIEGCAYLDLPILDGHMALNDARMTAKLALSLFRKYGPVDSPPTCRISAPIQFEANRRSRVPRVQSSGEEKSKTFLSALVERLPQTTFRDNLNTAAVSCYLELLDRVLDDRILTDDEALALFELADSEGLTRSTIQAIHSSYFLQLLEVAKSDHFLSVSERSDLRKVANLLDVSGWEQLVEQAVEIKVWSGGIPAHVSNSQPGVSSEFSNNEASLNFEDPSLSQLLAGKSIVITGEFSEFSRSQGHQAIANRGGKPTSGISKKTFALVAGQEAGPSKLEKASALGVPILNFAEFQQLLLTGNLPSRPGRP